MELNEYQETAMTTCMASSKNFSYMFLNLVGEVGELASKVAKGIRKEHYNIQENALWIGDNWSAKEEQGSELELMQEAGDILWQLSGLCYIMGWSLESIGQLNLKKLQDRQERGVIDGNGDNR